MFDLIIGYEVFGFYNEQTTVFQLLGTAFCYQNHALLYKLCSCLVYHESSGYEDGTQNG